MMEATGHHDHGHTHDIKEFMPVFLSKAKHSDSKDADQHTHHHHGHNHGPSDHTYKNLEEEDSHQEHHNHGHTSHEVVKLVSHHTEDQHDHEKSHRDDVQRRLKLASVLCFIFLVSEISGGYIAGSLAVLSDAAHLFSDFMGFVFAVAAGYMASMPGSENYVSIVYQLCNVSLSYNHMLI